MNSSSCNIKASSLGTEDSSSYLSDMLASLTDCINPIDTLTVENSLQLAKLMQGKLLSLCNSYLVFNPSRTPVCDTTQDSGEQRCLQRQLAAMDSLAQASGGWKWAPDRKMALVFGFWEKAS